MIRISTVSDICSIDKMSAKILCLFLCLVFEQAYLEPVEGTCCPNGWLAYENSCYLFADELSVDWTEATHFCSSHAQANVVVLDSKGEEMLLRDQAHRLFKCGADHTFFWIGATDDEIEGEWTWYTTRQRVSDGYTNWYPGQPETGNSNNQDCACLWGQSDFTWHDYHCESKGHVICEKKHRRFNLESAVDQVLESGDPDQQQRQRRGCWS